MSKVSLLQIVSNLKAQLQVISVDILYCHGNYHLNRRSLGQNTKIVVPKKIVFFIQRQHSVVFRSNSHTLWQSNLVIQSTVFFFYEYRLWKNLILQVVKVRTICKVVKDFKKTVKRSCIILSIFSETSLRKLEKSSKISENPTISLTKSLCGSAVTIKLRRTSKICMHRDDWVNRPV